MAEDGQMTGSAGYHRHKPKWRWREFLTEEERRILKRADGAKLEWLQLNRERAAITNRAIQRARYAALSPTPQARKETET